MDGDKKCAKDQCAGYCDECHSECRANEVAALHKRIALLEGQRVVALERLGGSIAAQNMQDSRSRREPDWEKLARTGMNAAADFMLHHPKETLARDVDAAAAFIAAALKAAHTGGTDGKA